MNEQEMQALAQPTIDLLQSGQVKGLTYFFEAGTHTYVAFGTQGLGEADVAAGCYALMQAAGCDVERLCTAMIVMSRIKN